MIKTVNFHVDLSGPWEFMKRGATVTYHSSHSFKLYEVVKRLPVPFIFRINDNGSQIYVNYHKSSLNSEISRANTFLILPEILLLTPNSHGTGLLLAPSDYNRDLSYSYLRSKYGHRFRGLYRYCDLYIKTYARSLLPFWEIPVANG
jgi:hypothetical protein